MKFTVRNFRPWFSCIPLIETCTTSIPTQNPSSTTHSQRSRDSSQFETQRAGASRSFTCENRSLENLPNPCTTTHVDKTQQRLAEQLCGFKENHRTLSTEPPIEYIYIYIYIENLCTQDDALKLLACQSLSACWCREETGNWSLPPLSLVDGLESRQGHCLGGRMWTLHGCRDQVDPLVLLLLQQKRKIADLCKHGVGGWTASSHQFRKIPKDKLHHSLLPLESGCTLPSSQLLPLTPFQMWRLATCCFLHWWGKQ